MRIGNLVRHPLSGDIGVITKSWDGTYYTVAFFNGGEFMIPQEHLEIIA